MKKQKNTIELIHQATTTKITFCYGAKAYSKYMKKQFGLNEYIEHGGFTTIATNNNEYRIVIGIKEFGDIYKLKALLVHELSHTVSELMKEYGFVCDEFRSYTLQWLYQEIMPFLDKILLEERVKNEKNNKK